MSNVKSVKPVVAVVASPEEPSSESNGMPLLVDAQSLESDERELTQWRQLPDVGVDDESVFISQSGDIDASCGAADEDDGDDDSLNSQMSSVKSF